MRVAQHKAVSPVEIYQTYLKHFKCLEYLEKWSAQDDELIVKLVNKYGDKYWHQLT